MPRVIAVLNQKGGVAKTTTVQNVAVGLAQRGRRVLMVDLDSQASLTCVVGVEETPPSIADVLAEPDVDPADAIRSLPNGVDLLPSHRDLAAVEVLLAAAPDRQTRLRAVLGRLGDRYDHVLLDCSPSVGLLHVAALTAANLVVVPVQTEFPALAGLARLDATIAQVRAGLNPGLEGPIVVPTLFDGRYSHHRQMLEVLEERYGAALAPVVHRTIRNEDAVIARVSLLEHEPRGRVAAAYRELAGVVDGR
jgi:chromosome partitioning protein